MASVINHNNNNNNIPKGHKRQQASIGLGIVTHLTATAESNVLVDLNKNDTFFDLASSLSNPMKPPPPPIGFQSGDYTSRRNDDFDRSTLTESSLIDDYYNPPQPHQHSYTSPHETTSPPTFADRIRGIVFASRKNTAIAPSPDTNKSTIDTTDTVSTNSSHSNLSSASNSSCSLQNHVHNTSSESLQFSADKIIPLPSPAQPLDLKLPRCTTATTEELEQAEYDHLTTIIEEDNMFTVHPVESPLPPQPQFPIINTAATGPLSRTAAIISETPISAIPIISLSPSFMPNKTNIIPSLLEVPMLGDIDDLNYDSSSGPVNPQKKMASNSNNVITPGVIPREYKFPSPVPAHQPYRSSNEDNLLGKFIWKFRIRQLLGVGAFSKVFLADNIKEGGKFAIKTINKKKMKEDSRVRSSVEREVGVLKFLNHDRIVQLEATMETEQHLCIVLEYIQGGELFDFVQHMHSDIHKIGSQTSVDELLLKRLSLELIQVVSWLHAHNIVHRDLKLENILVYFDDLTGEPHLKLTDFGLARVVDPEEPILTTRCGSEEYAAPEIVLSQGYDGRLTDTWSIGVIVYALLVGYLPFSYSPEKGEKISHLFHRIISAQIKWPAKDNISAEAKEAVSQILVRNPEKRATLNQIERLAWFIK